MRLCLVVSLLSLTGCASGYSQFYQSYPQAEEAIARRESPPSTAPAAEQMYGDSDSAFAQYARRGYVPIGFSSFNSGRAETDANAIAQGRRVGADLVLIIPPQYTNTVSGSIPLNMPTTSTSYTTGSATAYGSGGTATAYGSSTTTTYGTRTTYVPYSVTRFDFGAVYYVKSRPRFGAYYRDLTSEERQKLQSNKGVALTLVVNDSPAFHGDFLDGDIITSANGEPIAGVEGMSNLIGANQGRNVSFTVVRGSTTQEKSVKLND
jgi:hypothetical protein